MTCSVCFRISSGGHLQTLNLNFEEFRAFLLSVALNVGHLSLASELLWLTYLWAINPGECCNHFIPVHAKITRAYSHMLQDNKSSILSVHNNLVSSYIFPFQNPPTSSRPRGGGGGGGGPRVLGVGGDKMGIRNGFDEFFCWEGGGYSGFQLTGMIKWRQQIQTQSPMPNFRAKSEFKRL